MCQQYFQHRASCKVSMAENFLIKLLKKFVECGIHSKFFMENLEEKNLINLNAQLKG